MPLGEKNTGWTQTIVESSDIIEWSIEKKGEATGGWFELLQVKALIERLLSSSDRGSGGIILMFGTVRRSLLSWYLFRLVARRAAEPE